MVIFLDTSSLVKLYYSEAGSSEFVEKITQQVSEIYLFQVSKVEFTSALWKKVRVGDIDQATCQEVLNLFDQDLENYHWITCSNEVIDAAVNRLHTYGLTSLRALDALQLSAALTVKNEVEVFITDDVFLRELFQKEGLKTDF